MKKLFVSLGLAAVGTAGLHAAYAPDGGPDLTKAWTISGTLRGFYDNNYATGSTSRGSYGFEVSPSISLNVPMQQTEVGVRYTYGLYYYQDRDELNENPIDQTHQLDLWVDHAFTESWQGRVEDTLVIAQEPDLLSQGAPSADEQRVEGNNIVNSATMSLHTDWTREFSTELTYQNRFYDYQNSGATDASFGSGGAGASLAGLLNRDENYVSLDLQWHQSSTTTFLIGYEFSQINYVGDEPIAFIATPPGKFYMSNVRDNLSHYGYVGFQSQILANLTASAKVGVQYTDDYNDPLGTTSFGPYADASLTYTYLPGDYVQIGVTHTRNATDQIDLNTTTGSIALDQESTLIYGSINHMLTPKLLATLIGQIQDSTYNGGTFNDESDVFYDLGLNLNYTFTRHFSGEVGYNFDHDSSKIPGLDYYRNRVYIGVTATY
jgi:hypothetical protein